MSGSASAEGVGLTAAHMLDCIQQATERTNSAMDFIDAMTGEAKACTTSQLLFQVLPACQVNVMLHVWLQVLSSDDMQFADTHPSGSNRQSIMHRAVTCHWHLPQRRPHLHAGSAGSPPRRASGLCLPCRLGPQPSHARLARDCCQHSLHVPVQSSGSPAGPQLAREQAAKGAARDSGDHCCVDQPLSTRSVLFPRSRHNCISLTLLWHVPCSGNLTGTTLSRVWTGAGLEGLQCGDPHKDHHGAVGGTRVRAPAKEGPQMRPL
jgi:hypothetical protein